MNETLPQDTYYGPYETEYGEGEENEPLRPEEFLPHLLTHISELEESHAQMRQEMWCHKLKLALLKAGLLDPDFADLPPFQPIYDSCQAQEAEGGAIDEDSLSNLIVSIKQAHPYLFEA